jgi:hypothetical protein
MEVASADERRTCETRCALDVQFAFGCHHRQISRVFTIKKRTYQVCFKCGQELEYSWVSMHPLRSSVAPNSYAPLGTVERADVSAI